MSARPASQLPTIAVCVSSRNRAALIDRLLDSLAAQTIPIEQFEVVVVDDGSTDDTTAVLERHVSAGRLTLRTLHHEHSRGPAAGRNAAWRAATAPYIAFTDDDCVPAPTWLAAGAAGLGAGNSLLVGRIQPNPDQLSDLGPFAHTWRTTKDDLRSYPTANLFARRADLELLGGFDEQFRKPACEDTDLGFRAEERGLPIDYSADAMVWHDVRRDGVLGKVRDQGRWSDLPRLFRDHPDARRSLLVQGVFWKRSHLDLLLLLAGVAIAPRDRRALAAALPWLHGKLAKQDVDDVTAATVKDLPGMLAVDVAEVVAMVRGSIKHRTLML